MSRNCHTFAIGKFQGKYGVAVGVEKQVKVFVFTHHEEAEPMDTIELDEIPSSQSRKPSSTNQKMTLTYGMQPKHIKLVEQFDLTRFKSTLRPRSR